MEKSFGYRTTTCWGYPGKAGKGALEKSSITECSLRGVNGPAALKPSSDYSTRGASGVVTCLLIGAKT